MIGLLPFVFSIVLPVAEAASNLPAWLRAFPFPEVNATLNGTAGLLLLAGFVAIKAKAVRLHTYLMIAAVVCSAIFLVSYLTYHFAKQGITTFPPGPWRSTYLAILLSHTILAVVVVPLVVWTLIKAYKKQWDAHRRIAWITFPIWLYVSITGVVVYWMLYQWK